MRCAASAPSSSARCSRPRAFTGWRAGLDDFDLGQFIAQLRSEVLVARGGTAPVLVGPRRHRVDTVAGVANELKAQGRLTRQRPRAVEPDRRRASSPAAAKRRCSASRCASCRRPTRRRPRARGRAAAGPGVTPRRRPRWPPRCTARRSRAVQVALLGALASLAKVEALPVVTPLLTSRAPEVRIAALKALLTLDAAAAAPHLAAATKDPDKAVRRRASLLALGLSGHGSARAGHPGHSRRGRRRALAGGAGAGREQRRGGAPAAAGGDARRRSARAPRGQPVALAPARPGRHLAGVASTTPTAAARCAAWPPCPRSRSTARLRSPSGPVSPAERRSRRSLSASRQPFEPPLSPRVAQPARPRTPLGRTPAAPLSPAERPVPPLSLQRAAPPRRSRSRGRARGHRSRRARPRCSPPRCASCAPPFAAAS